MGVFSLEDGALHRRGQVQRRERDGNILILLIPRLNGAGTAQRADSAPSLPLCVRPA